MKIINELKTILDLIPTSYMMAYNSELDSKIKVYDIESLTELINKTHKLSTREQNYILYRWFICHTSKMDEKLFTVCDNVEKNPNKYSNEYDISIGRIKFVLTTIKISEQFRVNYDRILMNPKPYIDSLYETQIREVTKNNLFIVYVSDKTPENTNHLRLNYEIKSAAIADYCVRFDPSQLFKVGNVLSDVIFIREDENGIITYNIGSRNGSNTK